MGARQQTPTPPLEVLVQLRTTHLTLVQGVISRLAGNSATAKNFSITILAGAVVTAVGTERWSIPLLTLALLAPLAFGLLDAYFLGLEHSARRLYDDIAARPLEQAEDMAIAIRGNMTKGLASLSVWPLYSAQAIVAILFLCYVTAYDQPKLPGHGHRERPIQHSPDPAQRPTGQPDRTSHPAPKPTPAAAP